MRKVISIVLCMALIGCFWGCGAEEKGQNPAGIQETAEIVREESEQFPQESGQFTEELEQSPTEEVPTTYVPLTSGGKGRYMEEEVADFRQYEKGMTATAEGVWVLGATEALFRKNGSDEFETVSYPQIIRETYWSRATVSDQGDMAFGCFEKNDQGTYEYVLRAVKKDGTVIELERFAQGAIGDMEFGPNGKLYVHLFGARLGIYCYELEKGEGERVFVTSSVTDDIAFVGNLLLAVDEGKVWIYDMETGELKEQDPVLDAFCKENITGLGGYGEGALMACIVGSEEENVLYLVCEKGIFRHVLYGSIMEQVANGELNMLSNPSTVLHGAASWKDENGNVAFLVDTYPGKLVNYVYDPEAATVPEVMLRVYSLEESEDLRQIIALFQQTYPECYVKYEVGLSGAGAANVEDKIKQLNTAILSGNGPDILLTDGLDESNYSEKGVLLDLSFLAEEMTDEDALASNLIEALRQDGKIYSLPVAFCIPMIAGEKEFVESVHDIESLAAAVEAVREENPEGVILTSMLPEAILAVLAQTESGTWVKDGSLDEDALRDFLSCAYRLYEAETKGAAEAKREQEQSVLEESIAYISPSLITRLEEIYYNFNGTLIDVMLKSKLAAIGYAGTPIELCWVDQLPENYTFAPLEDKQGVGYKPVMRLAINSMSSEQEMAQNFVRLALSAKAGELNFSSGIPVNVEAAEQILTDWKDVPWRMAGTNAIGEEIDLSAEWPSQRTLGKFQEAIGSVDHVIEEDFYLLQQVVEIGGKAMQEGKTVDEAVAKIKRKVAIYLAE